MPDPRTTQVLSGFPVLVIDVILSFIPEQTGANTLENYIKINET